MDLVASQPIGGWVKPESAYIHIPFCRHRCGYCNFSVVANREDLIDRYLSAIQNELSALDRPKLQTLFLGGGTPTHLSNLKIGELMKCLHSYFDLSGVAELSIEANPEDINVEKIACLADYGVNRISLGVQSFQTEKLKTLERHHSGDEAVKAVQLAADRFPNVSIDLIFGAPNETPRQWENDLVTAFDLPIKHLSTYALTYEKGTQFWNQRRRGQLTELDDSIEIEMFEMTRQRCREHNFNHYEISNFSRDESQCLHNMAYWRGEGWYAAGPGAARFVDGIREVNHRSTSNYLRKIERGESPTQEREPISLLQYAKERAAFGIRLLEGIDLNALNEHVGFDTTELLNQAIARSCSDGLISWVNGRMKLSSEGILFADTVAQRILDS